MRCDKITFVSNFTNLQSAYESGSTELTDQLELAARIVSEQQNGINVSKLDPLIQDLQRSFPLAIGKENERQRLVDWAADLPETPASVYLRARLHSDVGNWADAATAWNRLFQIYQAKDASWVLQQVRALAECNRNSEAISALRPALTPPPRYSLLSRAEKLIRKLSEVDDTYLREARAAFLGSYTTSLLVPVFRTLAFRDRVKVATYEGLYGSTDVEILDPHSKLGEFKPNIVFLLDTWRSLKLPPVVEDEGRFLDDLLTVYRARWKQLSDRFSCHIVQCSFDFPQEESYGYLAGSLAGGRTRLVELINLRLRSEAPSFVSILDAAAIQRKWETPRGRFTLVVFIPAASLHGSSPRVG